MKGHEAEHQEATEQVDASDAWRGARRRRASATSQTAAAIAASNATSAPIIEAIDLS
jgi:hypothetical protein